MRLPLAAALVAAFLVPAPVATAGDAVFRGAPTPCSAGRVALTFDDGPSSRVTPSLVRMLRRLHVPATFFMVGERVDASPATARLVERSGFLIGNHSYRHEDMTHQSAEEIRRTIENTRAALVRAAVHPTDLVRPPYGAVDAHVLSAIRREHDVTTLWDVDPRDWAGGTGAQIADRFLAGLHPGDNVVIQHDGVTNSPNTVAAIPAEVSTARKRGYCFAGLDARGHPGYPTPSAVLSVAPPDRHVVEGETLHLTISLSGEAGRDTSLRLLLRGRDASLRSDLTRPRSTIRFPAGRLEAQVDIPITADGIAEGKERFEIRIADGEGISPDRGRTTIVIEDGGGPPAS